MEFRDHLEAGAVGKESMVWDVRSLQPILFQKVRNKLVQLSFFQVEL